MSLFFWCLFPSCTFWLLCNLLLLITFCQVCLPVKQTSEIETGLAEKSSWDQANIWQKLGLVWRNRKKISQIIKDSFYLPFFLLIILWTESNAKCRHLNKFTCKGTLGQVFICLRPSSLLVFCLGWSSNFVGSESVSYRIWSHSITTQHPLWPHPSQPYTVCSAYTVIWQREGGEGGRGGEVNQREG